MKPIELTIQGLNSFREVQHIDFETLSADGIFGIFGPTGSGKSTILDAVTLALYGTVERASNNTQGILNQLEDQLSVGFTFELAGAKTDRYRAERSYKRTKDGGLRLGTCRLLRLNGEKEVLADKEKDVTRRIQDILGLTHDDFTRAVVLPQGKFSEFLTLKGNERRKMLQRLFHLEKYGDELLAKLKMHYEAVTRRLEIISEKEALLGDASRQAVDKLRGEYQLLKKEFSETRTRMENYGQERDQIRQVWMLQEEKDRKIKAQHELVALQPDIEDKKRLLKLSDKADKMIPYLEHLIATEKENQEAGVEFARADSLFLKSRTSEEETRGKYATAKQLLEEKEPLLSARRQELVQGQGIRRQLDTGLKERLSALTSFNELEKQIQSVNEKINLEVKRKSELGLSLENLEKTLSDIEVPNSQRTMIYQARDGKKAIDAMEDRLKEKRADWKKAQKNFLDNQQALEGEISRQEETVIHAEQWFQQCRRIYNRTENAGSAIRLLLEFVRRKQEEAAQERDLAYKQLLSLNLASGLKDGEPCPVCGAVHHPNPAVRISHPDQEGPDKKITYYRKSEDALIRFQQENNTCGFQLEEQSKNLSAIFPHRPVTDNHSEDQDESSDQVNFAEWESHGIKEALDQAALDIREQKQDIIASGETLTKYIDQARELNQKRISLEANLKIYKESKQKIEDEALNLKHELEKLIAEWPKNFPKPDDVAEIDQKIQNADQEAERIRKQIVEVRVALTKMEQKFKSDQDENARIEAKRNEIRGKLENIRFSLANREQELSLLHLSPDSLVKMMLEELDDELRTLKESREQHYQMWQGALSEFNEADKLRSGAAARLERAKNNLKSAELKWDERMNQSGFATRNAVLSAHMTEEKRGETEKRIESYEKDTVQLASDLRTLSEKLAGQSVTKDQLADAEERYSQLEKSVQQLSERLGASSTALEDITKRNALFEELESGRKTDEKAEGQFEKMQRVFRGNAFVEFVAEEQLQSVCLAASKRLGDLTSGRYALETDEGGGFIIRDNGNGGILRPVSSLSGGETFLTSLALALSLSEQIQLRGNVPLQFFFLDEGFGTLDPELLDTVITALERLHMRKLFIGVISHVPEMRERLPRRLVVEPAEPSGRGSQVSMEYL